jgi:GH24 family phage-related lysozyme (muramidase)
MTNKNGRWNWYGENKETMQISEEGTSLIKSYEGCRLEAYQDSVDVWVVV